MKKWLLLLGFALNFTGNLLPMKGPLAHLMTGPEKQKPPYSLESSRWEVGLDSHDWYELFSHPDIFDNQWYVQKLVRTPISHLNTIDWLNPSSLFQIFLDLHETTFEKCANIMHQLIINGLDTRLKQDVKPELLQKRQIRYETIVKDMKKYGFTLAPLAPATPQAPKQEPEKQQPADIKSASGEHGLKEPVKKSALATTDEKVELEQGQEKLDKSDVFNVIQKIKKPLLYTGIGVAVLAAAYIIYKKYIKKPVDAQNDEEIAGSQLTPDKGLS